MNYSNAQLEELAKNNPTELIDLINKSNSNIDLLTRAVETMGDEIKDETIVLPVLKRLLKHIHAQVRESAILATASFYANQSLPADILERLRVIAKSDPSTIVKDCSQDTLDHFR